MSSSVTFRPITDADREFLYRVYASTREEELRQTPWSDEQKTQFLHMQFHAQHTHYQEHYKEARFDIILHDDQPIGRLYVDRRADEIRVIDIALLTEHRSAGIGGQIMKEVLDEAAAAGKPVRIHVEQNNPAMRLYNRLGFRKIGNTGIYDLMEWTAQNDGK